jgi:hypothetical protein
MVALLLHLANRNNTSAAKKNQALSFSERLFSYMEDGLEWAA